MRQRRAEILSMPVCGERNGIRAATPRALYFNDDAYVAWVQGSDMLEFAAIDSELGAVFYTLTNRQDASAGFAAQSPGAGAGDDGATRPGDAVRRCCAPRNS